METINLLLCTVKRIPVPDKDHCFAVLSPTVNMTLQALDEKDRVIPSRLVFSRLCHLSKSIVKILKHVYHLRRRNGFQ